LTGPRTTLVPYKLPGCSTLSFTFPRCSLLFMSVVPFDCLCCSLHCDSPQLFLHCFAVVPFKPPVVPSQLPVVPPHSPRCSLCCPVVPCISLCCSGYCPRCSTCCPRCSFYPFRVPSTLSVVTFPLRVVPFFSRLFRSHSFDSVALTLIRTHESQPMRVPSQSESHSTTTGVRQH
jgi:hypothetical protein